MSLSQIKQPKPSVPGPRGWPVVGVLPQLLKHDTLSVLEEARRDHGDLFKLRVGPGSLVIASHPEHARHILQTNNQNYTKGKVYDPGRRWMIGDGLIASTGEHWLRQRRMMQPHFHRQQLAGITTLMTDAIGEALASWTPVARERRVLQLDQAMARLSIKVVTRTLFGRGQLSEAEMDEVGAAFLTLMRQLTPRLFLYFLPEKLPLPGDRALRRARQTIDAAIYKLIAARRRSPGGNDLLAMLMGAVDEEGQGDAGMTDAQLRNEVASLFIAGYDTVATGLTWTWYLLSEYPAAAARLREEVDVVLGGRTPTFADLKTLPYTRNVLRESLRLRPPVGMVPRTLGADDELDGYPLCEGTTVWLYIYGIHHHTGFWDAPENFVPERFESSDHHRFAYLPFIAGPRQCIGNEFALMEMALVLAMAIQRFEVEILPDSPVEPLLTTVLKPRQGVRAVVNLRE